MRDEIMFDNSVFRFSCVAFKLIKAKEDKISKWQNEAKFGNIFKRLGKISFNVKSVDRHLLTVHSCGSTTTLKKHLESKHQIYSEKMCMNQVQRSPNLKKLKQILQINKKLELRQCKNGFISVKFMLILKLPLFFPCRVGEEKRGGNFKTNMFFTEASLFLYCLSSS